MTEPLGAIKEPGSDHGNGQIDMASLGRSFKPPSYLSRRARPAAPGRTLSNSSQLSSYSASSADEIAEPPGSHHVGTTPLHEGGPLPLRASRDAKSQTKGDSPSTKVIDERTASVSSAATRAKPIAIELPTVRRVNTAAVYTPPEPLSARGDLPGGYFPLHEDPAARVHRPHPFHVDASKAHLQPGPATPEAGSARNVQATSMPNTLSLPLQPHAGAATAHTPITSYIPSGAHDSPLPLGKYYPSNYEKRNRQRPSPAPGISSSAKSDNQIPKFASSSSASGQDSDIKRKLRQYQRDMIAQASLAASEVLGTDSKLPASIASSGIALPSPAWELHFGATSTVTKPVSPRLAPLGSPGPVTPMELEAAEGSTYLDKGRGTASRPEKTGALKP